MRGPWWGAAGTDGHVSVLAGLRGALSESQVLHAAGVDIDSENLAGIPRALELCAQADVILLCLGEAAAMSGEAASRAHPHLPGRQRQLAEAVFDRARALRKAVVVILFSGRPLIVPWLIERADSALAAWFLGSEAGNALADLITGRVSPSGRTPVTWARSLGRCRCSSPRDRPAARPTRKDFYTSKYLDVSNEPLFAFGHGLTYGQFTLSNLRMSRESVTEDDTLEIRVDVRTAGRAAPKRRFSSSPTTSSPAWPGRCSS